MIAGLETPDSGEVIIDGKVVMMFRPVSVGLDLYFRIMRCFAI